MSDRLILEVFVRIDRNGISRVESENAGVTMIPFTGTARGEVFDGVIAPGGVDTQTVDARGVKSMSARYVLTGTDMTGTPCQIYVCNEGRFEDGKVPWPFHTVPSFITDSAALKARFSGHRYRGEGHPGEEGPVIRFFEMSGD